MRASLLLWILFAFFAIAIGVYPFLYFMVDMKEGFLNSKPLEILTDTRWMNLFHMHIVFGGIALLAGWSQFIERFRNKWMTFHRLLGKIYVISVVVSGLASLYLAFFSNGGMATHFGFGFLGLFWLTTTVLAYTTIKKRAITSHKKWMIRSYALCFASVTLRIWLPLFIGFSFMEFEPAYQIVSWLCWVPNLLVAEWIIRKQSAKNEFQPMIKEVA